MVYFSLRDNSPAEIEKLVEACRHYLSDHDGTVFFAVGTRTPDLQRPVNDSDFDVALQVVFESREAHDRYQVDERHVTFIETNKANWSQVRVFDADVS